MSEYDLNELRKIERLRKVIVIAAIAVVLFLIVGTIALIAFGESPDMRW